MRQSFISFIIITFSALLLASCGGGGSSGSGGDSTGSATDIASAASRIGINECVGCHVGGTADGDSKFTEAYSKWLVGPHGNFQYKVNAEDATAAEQALGYYAETSHGNRYYFTYNHFSDELVNNSDTTAFNKYSGYPYESFFDNYADSEYDCKSCHGPSDLDNEGVAEMPIITELITLFTQNTRGINPDWDAELAGSTNDKTLDWENAHQKERLVIGCESCHGGGSMHQIDPNLLPEFTPDAETCADCHGPDHFHSGGDIYSEYASSPHAKSLSGNTHIVADDEGKVNYARCAKCHTDEYGRKWKDFDADTYAEMGTTFEDMTRPDYEDLSDISCRTCHDAHNPHEYLEKATVTAGVVTRSAQFNTCTNCHQLYNTADDGMAEAYHDPSVNQYGAENEIITDTHYATDITFNAGGSTPVSAKWISGYAVDPASDEACSSCHNVHEAEITINQQWSNSAHANKNTEGAWAHYNWGDGANRAVCQRCHTTTGFETLADESGEYDVYTAQITDGNDNTWKPEMLQCQGCHTDSKGTIRDPGKFADVVANIADTSGITNGYATYAYSPNETRVDNVPDQAGVNVCMPCHAGGRSAQAIEDWADDNPGTVYTHVAANGFAFTFNPHYLAAGATLYQTGAYEFSGQEYPEAADLTHATIGTADSEGAEVVEGSGTNGPCAGCHMNDSSHKLRIVDSADEIIPAEMCATCHTGDYALTAEKLEEEKEAYEEALSALAAAMTDAGFAPSDSFPYVTPASWGTTATFKNNLGATFNYVQLHHEEGAYAHNRNYVRKIIFDSIDWMQNGSLTGTIDLTGYTEAAHWMKADDASAVSRP